MKYSESQTTLNDNHADDSPNINRNKETHTHTLRQKKVANERRNRFIDIENANRKKIAAANKRNVEKEIPFTFIMNRSSHRGFVFFRHIFTLLVLFDSISSATTLFQAHSDFLSNHSLSHSRTPSLTLSRSFGHRLSRFGCTSFVPHRLTLNIYHHRFLCGCTEYDFSSIALPIP